MRHLIAAAGLAVLPGFALADMDLERLRAEGTVAETMDRLEAVVTEAGATVFARVDHGGGAANAGMDLPDAELLIFGTPQMGTPAMQADIAAGLVLPLRVLVHDTEGQTWIVYQEVEEMFDDLDIDDDADFVEKMEDALEALTGKAAQSDS